MLNPRGYLEYVQAFRLHGWAYSDDTPTHRLTVEIACGDMVLGRTVAEVFRDDLREAGIGDGAHGFIFDFAENLSNDDLQRVVARVVCEDGGTVTLERLDYTPSVEAAPPTPAEDAPEFPGPINDTSQYPLFILGSTRSGTSAVAQALTASGRFWGYNEGHLLDLFAHLADSVRAFYDQKETAGALNGATFISHVPMSFLHKGIQSLFVDLIRTMTPTPWWFDKTPNHHMIQLAPHFLAMWPNAQFIFLRRRALEFIESRRRKFPHVSFEMNCREWTAVMTAWMNVRNRLDGHVLEVEQLHMARAPEAVARTIAEMAGLDRTQSTRFAQSLAGDRPEQTGDSSASVLHIDELDWSRDEREIFDRFCRPMMDRCGYTTDRRYSARTVH